MESPPPSSPPQRMEIEGTSATPPSPNQHQESTLVDLGEQVAEGVEVLNKLEAILTKYAHGTSNQDGGWLRQLQNVRQKAEKPHIAIGIVGSTGAGKSSVINALLDEERLVPTNGMRACTSVVTEISYNHDDNFGYRAEIEFISKQEWAEELALLFGDFEDEGFTEQTGAKETSTDMAIAAAKIKAIYGIENKDIMNYSANDLVGRENVSKYLGTTVTIEDNNAPSFYQALQNYVDSPEKGRPRVTTQSQKKDDGSQTVNMQESAAQHKIQFWPLIRVVRLNVKAAALSTGAVIIDLPGMLDSNAARANVANSYLEKCSKLWIVAPINRAVDDRTAATLLGDAFKRQVQMDGSLNSLSFICSKTDDVNLTEMAEYADFGESEQDTMDSLHETISHLKYDIEVLDDKLCGLQLEQDSIENKEKTLRDALRKKESLQVPAKRKHSMVDDPENEEDSCMENVSEADGSSPMLLSASDDDDNKDDGSDNASYMAVSQLEAKLEDSQRRRAQAASRRKSMEMEKSRAKRSLTEAKKEKDALQLELARRCVCARNLHAKRHIQLDFAAGVRQLDEENDAVQNGDHDPFVPVRDYDKVGQKLNVFCVSAKAYQKPRGRFKRDHDMKGFKNPDETEIPRLQKYCIESTTESRKVARRVFLNELGQLLNSLKLCSESSLVNYLTEETRKEDLTFFHEQLEALRMNITSTIGSTSQKLEKEFTDHVFKFLDLAAERAVFDVDRIVADWNSVERGRKIPFSTYRAICRRIGVFRNARGKFNWNEDLVQPMLLTISPGWERVFSRRGQIASHMKWLGFDLQNHVQVFQTNIATHFMHRAAYASIFQTLEGQLHTYKESASYISEPTKRFIDEEQKAKNRILPIYVVRALRPTYKRASDVKGKGSYRTMKEIITEDVGRARTKMFKDASKGLKKALQDLLNTVRQRLNDDTAIMMDVIHRDYNNMFQMSQTVEDRSSTARSFPSSRTLKSSHSNKLASQRQRNLVDMFSQNMLHPHLRQT